VLGYHHPLEIVKRYGTLDVASGGRVILGVGVGSLQEEFALLGRPFDDRGVRADDALRAIRASFGRRTPSHRGTHHRFDSVVVEPSGLQEDVPIWVGGRTRRSLRRALELGDGWIPFGLDLEGLRSILGGAGSREAADLRPGFDLVLAPEPPLDPLADGAGTARTVASYAGVGATALAVRVRHTSRLHYLEQLAALCDVVAAEVGLDRIEEVR
jgi:hypothetical protein